MILRVHYIQFCVLFDSEMRFFLFPAVCNCQDNNFMKIIDLIFADKMSMIKKVKVLFILCSEY